MRVLISCNVIGSEQGEEEHFYNHATTHVSLDRFNEIQWYPLWLCNIWLIRTEIEVGALLKLPPKPYFLSGDKMDGKIDQLFSKKRDNGSTKEEQTTNLIQNAPSRKEYTRVPLFII